MLIFYDPKMVPTVHGAFVATMQNNQGLAELAANIISARLQNPIGEMSETTTSERPNVVEINKILGAPAPQVAVTLFGSINIIPGTNTKLIPVYAKDIKALDLAGVQEQIARLSSQGLDTPFLLALEKDDIQTETDNAIFVIAGIEEKPDTNFISMTIDKTGLIQELEKQCGDGLYNNEITIVNPFAVTGGTCYGTLGNFFPQDVIAIRRYLLADGSTLPQIAEDLKNAIQQREEEEPDVGGEE